MLKSKKKIKVLFIVIVCIMVVVGYKKYQKNDVETRYISKVSFEYSSEGAALFGIYTSHNKLQYLSVDILGEMGRQIHEVSFIGNSITYSFFEIIYQEPFYLDPDNIKIKEYTNKRYYLNEGNMYDCTASDNMILVPQNCYVDTINKIEEFIELFEKEE